MRLNCHLRRLRGDRRIEEFAEATGIHRGTLSRIERGVLLPLDSQLEAIAEAYGVPPWEWYDEVATLAIQRDEQA